MEIKYAEVYEGVVKVYENPPGGVVVTSGTPAAGTPAGSNLVVPIKFREGIQFGCLFSVWSQ